MSCGVLRVAAAVLATVPVIDARQALVGTPLAAVSSPAVECDSHSIRERVAHAVQEIEHVVDPCGDSAEIGRIIESFRRCDPTSYKICVDTRSPRNYVDPGARGNPPQPTALVWNPELRNELESSCNGDDSRPLLREPNASLLHELVHIVQDCSGLDPAAHESEAVRIENIYRRARGLCQRTRYGNEALPPDAFVACRGDSCSCPPYDRPLPAVMPLRGPRIAARSADANPQAAGDTSRDGQGPGDSPGRVR